MTGKLDNTKTNTCSQVACNKVVKYLLIRRNVVKKYALKNSCATLSAKSSFD